VLAKTRRPEGGSAICCLWGFVAGILRITALHSLGIRRLDSESPQQKYTNLEIDLDKASKNKATINILLAECRFLKSWIQQSILCRSVNMLNWYQGCHFCGQILAKLLPSVYLKKKETVLTVTMFCLLTFKTIWITLYAGTTFNKGYQGGHLFPW
jgi:hypothetical protein